MGKSTGSTANNDAAEANRLQEEAAAAAEANRLQEEAAAAEANRLQEEAAAAEANRLQEEAAAAEAEETVEAVALRDSQFGFIGSIVRLPKSQAEAGSDIGALDLHPDAIKAAKVK